MIKYCIGVKLSFTSVSKERRPKHVTTNHTSTNKGNKEEIGMGYGLKLKLGWDLNLTLVLSPN